MQRAQACGEIKTKTSGASEASGAPWCREPRAEMESELTRAERAQRAESTGRYSDQTFLGDRCETLAVGVEYASEDDGARRVGGG